MLNILLSIALLLPQAADEQSAESAALNTCLVGEAMRLSSVKETADVVGIAVWVACRQKWAELSRSIIRARPTGSDMALLSDMLDGVERRHRDLAVAAVVEVRLTTTP
ncbi:hypothetical protein [Sphingopyxis witflariensis]|uniref:Uncharacterized protein n=1 Tax=Sphingopyxis witflariensis TaxID=173675 RepID=A0A246JYI2_9SPHN|nr:hypothetical protein [Sphingopyxis witflariensis]OWQ98254.1 hypothetical protein CDQ91_06980 [Sphingopyxis witflariensis]